MRRLSQSITLSRKRNGSYVVLIETPEGILASKTFPSYEAWAEWAERVLGRVPGAAE